MSFRKRANSCSGMVSCLRLPKLGVRCADWVGGRSCLRRRRLLCRRLLRRHCNGRLRAVSVRNAGAVLLSSRFADRAPACNRAADRCWWPPSGPMPRTRPRSTFASAPRQRGVPGSATFKNRRQGTGQHGDRARHRRGSRLSGWRIDHVAGTGSSFTPRATIRSAPSARGRCSFRASLAGAVIQVSTSSGVVRIAGIAF